MQGDMCCHMSRPQHPIRTVMQLAATNNLLVALGWNSAQQSVTIPVVLSHLQMSHNTALLANQPNPIP